MNNALIQFLGIAVSAATIVNIVATIWLGVISHRIQKQQEQTSALRFRLALFEKRMAVFNTVKKFIEEVSRTTNVDLTQIFTMWRESRDSEFLFGDDVRKFVDDLYHRAAELHFDRETGSDVTAQQLAWFVHQLAEAKKVFLPYMDFRKP